MTTCIQIEDISKRYRLGARDQAAYTTLREAVSTAALAPWRRLRELSHWGSGGHEDHGSPQDKPLLWALRDVSFNVDQGEVVGLVGRNGAGKSTLLKVLSRITEPTSGRITLRGRLASLLEVGTGFHPELTGRENIFLNGAILGMSRREIQRKFDDIVTFSEIEQFIDTPVKRYSSGMFVRLAFAVASHLEPEILVVDEVLAVGDAGFQRKCLGKMQDVAGQGRTVIFVSHNMDTILRLCDKVVVLSAGRNTEPLPAEQGVREYLETTYADTAQCLADRPRYQVRPRPPIFVDLQIETGTGSDAVAAVGERVAFHIQMRDFEDLDQSVCGIVISNAREQRVMAFHTEYHSNLLLSGAPTARLTCDISKLDLVPGTYFVDLILADGHDVVERVERAAKLEIIFADVLGTGKLPNSQQGHVVVPCEWDFSPN